MKFEYGDRVLIKNGFLKGRSGIVRDACIELFIDGSYCRYIIELPSDPFPHNILEDNLELADAS